MADEEEVGLSAGDLMQLGETLIEMADRVSTAHVCCPGAQASYGFEIDDVRFKVVVTVEEPKS